MLQLTRWHAWNAALALSACLAACSPPAHAERGLWIDTERLRALPTSGSAWDHLRSTADRFAGLPNLSNQDDSVNVRIMAKALVYARTGDERYRRDVIAGCKGAIGTEGGGRTLALGRELAAYVIAADLVGLPADDDAIFRRWLGRVRHLDLQGRTLISTHEDRPNNWGTHAGASRLAVALYLGDSADEKRAALVFRGWLGDRSAYADFKYGKDLTWQEDPSRPVGINPLGATKLGMSIGGVLPDDQRRGGSFTWPPPKENYVYEGLQGALAQAILLHRAGYDVWNWQDKALLRAYEWLHEQADYPARKDDLWQLHVVNFYYGTAFPTTFDAEPGKNVGWTAWTHGSVDAPNTE